MKREVILALTGLALTLPLDAEGQRSDRRDRVRERDDRVERLEPVRAPGRVFQVRPAYRTMPARVVYSSRARYLDRAATGLWVRADLGTIQFRRGMPGRGVILTNRDLRDLLGAQNVRRIRQAASRAGIHGTLRGRWAGQRGRSRTLIVTIDRFEVAEFADYDGDGFVDRIYLIGDRRPHRTAVRW